MIFGKIYSIIEIGRVLNTIKKGEWIYILNRKLKYCTKEILKYFNIILIAIGFIIAIILIKYKPSYIVSISGKELGIIQNKQSLEELIENKVIATSQKNIDTVEMKENPEYELKLVDRTLKTNDDQIINEIQENLLITYKYYEIAFNNEKINSVNTIEEAEELIKQIKDDNEEKELDLSIIEKYTQNEDEVNTTKIEVAKQESEEMIKEKIEKQKEEKEEELMPEVNGIKLALKPISGTITSRYGESSSLRKSTHTGLDIAATTGTPIKVVADGIVTNASYSGSYGNLVKISHGDGVETWYAHTSKMYVTVGQKVSAGDTIAAVGSTGNSTGAHLHFEIRINGNHVNPQKYLYNQ